MKPQLTVMRAHQQMRGTYQYKGQKKGVENFLKKVKNPYDYDVSAYYEKDGEIEISYSVTGDDWLKDKNEFDHLNVS